MSVRMRNSKTIAPIDLNFLHKMYHAGASVLLKDDLDRDLLNTPAWSLGRVSNICHNNRQHMLIVDLEQCFDTVLSICSNTRPILYFSDPSVALLMRIFKITGFQENSKTKQQKKHVSESELQVNVVGEITSECIDCRSRKGWI